MRYAEETRGSGETGGPRKTGGQGTQGGLVETRGSGETVGSGKTEGKGSQEGQGRQEVQRRPLIFFLGGGFNSMDKIILPQQCIGVNRVQLGLFLHLNSKLLHIILVNDSSIENCNKSNNCRCNH